MTMQYVYAWGGYCLGFLEVKIWFIFDDFFFLLFLEKDIL